MKYTRKIRMDRIGSATLPARLTPIVEVSPEVVAAEGTIVAVRALSENRQYGEIELPSGRQSKVVKGNLIAGVLGARQALHGFMGDVPESVAVGDKLSLLNMGGLIGTCLSHNKSYGSPIPVEVLGGIVRGGVPLNIRDFGLPECTSLKEPGPPLAIVMGTCMNSGKTSAAAELIRILSHAGVRVAAGKLSGVAAIKDLLSMEDNGASPTSSFLHYGLPSTVKTKDLAPMARSVIARLEESDPQLILLELGDGIIGGYNVGSILHDDSIRSRTRLRVLCANDLVGAWGGAQLLESWGHKPDIISGPVSDNHVGINYVEREMGLRCANARNDAEGLARIAAGILGFAL